MVSEIVVIRLTTMSAILEEKKQSYNSPVYKERMVNNYPDGITVKKNERNIIVGLQL